MEIWDYSTDSDFLTNIEELDSTNSSPERSMLAAMLHRAIADLKDSDVKIRQDAQYWFNAKSSNRIYGTFLYICEQLDIENPTTFKKKVFKLIKNKTLRATVINRTNGKVRNNSRRMLRRPY